MDNKNHSVIPDDEEQDEIFEFNTFSFCDCTGLIPSALQSVEECDAYNEVYHFMPPEFKDKDK